MIETLFWLTRVIEIVQTRRATPFSGDSEQVTLEIARVKDEIRAAELELNRSDDSYDSDTLADAACEDNSPTPKEGLDHGPRDYEFRGAEDDESAAVVEELSLKLSRMRANFQKTYRKSLYCKDKDRVQLTHP